MRLSIVGAPFRRPGEAMSGSRSKKTSEKLPGLFSAWEWRLPASDTFQDPAESFSEEELLAMQAYQVTRERIRAIEAKALRKLRRKSTDVDDPPPTAALALPHPRALPTLDVRGSTTDSSNRGRCSPVPRK